MRVITGTARGRRLETLDGDKITRPTTEKVKEALFSMIQFDLEGRKVLDLFAGSGQLGIEALSRGAKSAFFIDSDKKAAEVVRKNVEKCDFLYQSDIRNVDSLVFLSGTREKFDIAFIDPPYHTGLLQKTIDKIANVMSEYGIMIFEHPFDENMPQNIGDFKLSKSRSYGKLITLSVYRKGDAED